MEDHKVFYLLLILGVASFIFAIYIYYKTIKALQLINKSKSWSSTNGNIVEAKLAHHIDNNDEQTSVKFFLIIEYSYQALEKQFKSKNRYASDDVMAFKFKPVNPKEEQVKQLSNFRKLKKSSNREKITELLDSFRGDEIKVFYDPKNPEQASILTDTPLGIYGNFFGATIILLASIGLLFLSQKLF